MSNYTIIIPKILDLKSSSEQIFSRKIAVGCPWQTIQHEITAALLFCLVAIYGCCMVNLIATSLSPVTSMRWRQEQTERTRIAELWITRGGLELPMSTPVNLNVFQRINAGCAIRLVNSSVAAIDSSVRCCFWSEIFVFFLQPKSPSHR